MPLVLEPMALPWILAKETPATPESSLSLFRDEWNKIDPLDKVYLITWNPKPRFYNYDLHGENDYEMQWRTMIDKLCCIDRCYQLFAFVAEISDVGKLHMHGFIVVNDRVKYHKQFLPTLRNNGFIKVSKAKSLKWGTFKYHVKELSDTAPYIKCNPYVLTSENIKAVKKELALYKSLIAHSYDEKGKKAIKKINVMRMLDFISEESGDTPYDF